jgi:hypothetical protein
MIWGSLLNTQLQQWNPISLLEQATVATVGTECWLTIITSNHSTVTMSLDTIIVFTIVAFVIPFE